jgi:hypothetical protein
MKVLLILLGQMTFSTVPDQIHRPPHDVKIFEFYSKDSCEKAADAMWKAYEVQSAVCVEVSR